MESRKMVELVIEAGRIISIKPTQADRRSGSFVQYKQEGLTCITLHAYTVVSAILYLVEQIVCADLPDDGNIFEFIKPSEGL